MESAESSGFRRCIRPRPGTRLTGLVGAVILLSAWSLAACAAPLANQLKDSPSPYLAAHGGDPVAWQAWSPATLALAREQNKLLFVSIGYFSCHWCHVMQRESYRNPEIAALINQGYIPVKVDRELDVALDAEMIAYAQISRGSSGWPLNVFITPEGYPLYAVLYEKPDRFLKLLSALRERWLADSAGLKAHAQQAAPAQAAVRKVRPSAALAAEYRKQLVSEALAQADLLGGGFNQPRKFPLSPMLAALLAIEERHHDARLADWLRLTLDQMARGGLRDHVAGGFFRYTVDPDWHTPHFEKMLYDNAQLAMLYLRAAKVLKRPTYRDIASATLDFMLAEMRSGGAFITSTSAVDEQDREGGAYLWTEKQLRQILDGEEYRLVARIWGMDTPAESELGYLPQNRNEFTAAEQIRLKELYRKLMQARQHRRIPKDVKLLAGLNGIALAALSEAAEVAPRYRQAADELRDFLLQRLWRNGELHKGMGRNQLLGSADLEGYAYAAAGLMRHARLSGSKEDAQTAREMARLAWRKFHTPRGFLLEQGGALAKPFYQDVVADGPLPSPSSVLIDLSLRAGDAALRAKARDALAQGLALQDRGLFWYASQVIALNRLFRAL